MKLVNITPQAMRCECGYCPSVSLRGDGKIIMVAKIATADDITGELPPYDLSTEVPVIFDPELIADVPRTKAEATDHLAAFRRCVEQDII